MGGCASAAGAAAAPRQADNVRGKIRFSISASFSDVFSVLESCLRLFLIFIVFAGNSASGNVRRSNQTPRLTKPRIIASKNVPKFSEARCLGIDIRQEGPLAGDDRKVS